MVINIDQSAGAGYGGATAEGMFKVRQERAQDRQAAEQTRQFDKGMAQRESEFGRDQSLKAMIASDQLAAAEHRLLLSEGGAMARQEKAAADNIIMQNDAQEAATEAASALAGSNKALAEVRNSGQLAVQGLANQGAKDRDAEAFRRLQKTGELTHNRALALQSQSFENQSTLNQEAASRDARQASLTYIRQKNLQKDRIDAAEKAAGAAGRAVAGRAVLDHTLDMVSRDLPSEALEALDESMIETYTATMENLTDPWQSRMATPASVSALIEVTRQLEPDPVIFSGVNVPVDPGSAASEVETAKYMEELKAAAIQMSAIGMAALKERIKNREDNRQARRIGTAAALSPLVSTLGPAAASAFNSALGAHLVPNTTTVAPPNPSVGGGTKPPTYTPSKTGTPLSINLGLGGTSQP